MPGFWFTEGFDTKDLQEAKCFTKRLLYNVKFKQDVKDKQDKNSKILFALFILFELFVEVRPPGHHALRDR